GSGNDTGETRTALFRGQADGYFRLRPGDDARREWPRGSPHHSRRHRPRDAGALDTLLVAGAEHLATDRISRALLDAVAGLSDGTARVASVYTGAFVLAELGFLDDRRATTHWRHAGLLARRYPKVDVQPDVIHIRD